MKDNKQDTISIEDKHLIRTGWRGWFLLYGIWTIPALIMAGGYYYAQLGSANDRGWWFALLDHMFYFALLATICPPIYRLTEKYRFAPTTWTTSSFIHLLMSFFLIIVVKIMWTIQSVVTGICTDPLWDAIITRLTDTRGYFGSMMIIVYYAVVVLAMIMIRLHRQRNRQEERNQELELKTSQLQAQLNDAQLQTLKMQLQPHFLFNALNTISALVESKQNDRAFKTIAQLGDLLRSSLKLPDSTTIPLKQELEFIEKYLSIERIRFSDRLNTRIDAAEEYSDVLVPALILQPLVENCIHHAAAAQLEPLDLIISAKKQGSQLILEVKDNGPGLPRGWNLEQDAGVGLKNVTQRLQVMYGAPGLELEPLVPKGVVVRVRIPFSTPRTLRQPNDSCFGAHV